MKVYDPAVVGGLPVCRGIRRGPIRSIEVRVLHPTSERQLAHARLLPPPTDIPPETIARLGAEGERLAGRGARTRRRPLAVSTRTSSSGASSTSWRSSAPSPATRSTSIRGRLARWGMATVVSIDGRLADDARFAIRWHFLPDYPAYREEVRVITEQASSSWSSPRRTFSTPRPTCGSLSSAGDGRRDTRFRSVAEAFEEELLAFHAPGRGRDAPKAGIVEGRADIVTSQRSSPAARRRSACRSGSRRRLDRAHDRPPRPAHPLGSRVVPAVPDLPDAAGRRLSTAARAAGGRSRLRFTLDGQTATVDDYLEIRPERRAADGARRRGPAGDRPVADPDGRVPGLR